MLLFLLAVFVASASAMDSMEGGKVMMMELNNGTENSQQQQQEQMAPPPPQQEQMAPPLPPPQQEQMAPPPPPPQQEQMAPPPPPPQQEQMAPPPPPPQQEQMAPPPPPPPSPPTSSSIANLSSESVPVPDVPPVVVPPKPTKTRPVVQQIHLTKADQLRVDEMLLSIRHKSPLEQERDMKVFARQEGGLIKRKIDSLLEMHAQAVEIFIEVAEEKLAKMSLRESKSGGDHVVLIMADRKLTAPEKAERVKDAVERLSKPAQKELMEANLADAMHIARKMGPFLNGPAFGP